MPDLILTPRATEKTYAAQTQRTYAFFVPKTFSKPQIAAAVSDQFKVTVTDVRTLLRNGKPLRFSRGRRAYPGTTYRQTRKLAYVTLKPGDRIKVFEEEPSKTSEAAA